VRFEKWILFKRLFVRVDYSPSSFLHKREKDKFRFLIKNKNKSRRIYGWISHLYFDLRW
jgi:hypothetical protein